MYHYTTNGGFTTSLALPLRRQGNAPESPGNAAHSQVRQGITWAEETPISHVIPMELPCNYHGISHLNKPCNILRCSETQGPSPCNRRRRGNSDGEALQCLFSPPNHAQNLATFSFSNCQHRGSLD